jgi:hypothetical protein
MVHHTRAGAALITRLLVAMAFAGSLLAITIVGAVPAAADTGPYSPCPGGVACYVSQGPNEHGDAGSYDFVPQGTDQLVSIVSGTVHYAQAGIADDQSYSSPSLGNVLWVDGDDGYCYLMGHIRQGSITVSPGQYVNHGQAVATMGHSGYAFGDHTHVDRMTECHTYVDGDGNETAYGTVQPISFADVGSPSAGQAPTSGNYQQ